MHRVVLAREKDDDHESHSPPPRLADFHYLYVLPFRERDDDRISVEDDFVRDDASGRRHCCLFKRRAFRFGLIRLRSRVEAKRRMEEEEEGDEEKGRKIEFLRETFLVDRASEERTFDSRAQSPDAENKSRGPSESP